MRMNAVLSNPKHPEYGQFTESIYECLTKTFGNNPALEQGGQSEMKL